MIVEWRKRMNQSPRYAIYSQLIDHPGMPDEDVGDQWLSTSRGYLIFRSYHLPYREYIK
jgi:hypothetical protein